MYLWPRNMNQQQTRENFTATNSKKGFTQHYGLLKRVNCQHLKCLRTMKEVLKDKWYGSAKLSVLVSQREAI